jgi:uncharacterized protein (TIGR03437 family)
MLLEWIAILASFAPSYTAASIVNAASFQPDAFAPNTYISIYGTNLSWVTRAIGPEDISSGELPTALMNTGVRVSVRGIAAHILYVSPTQINALIPTDLLPGPAEIAVARDGVWGPLVKVDLRAQAPALFLLDATTAIATHADGRVITEDQPAAPGEVVILYATGLGTTLPPQVYGRLATAAAPLLHPEQSQVLLQGEAVPQAAVEYAGIAPGFAGLYQINLRLPASVTPDPEIRVQIGTERSPECIHLPVQPNPPQPSASLPR